jgi:hypothetical protein
LKFGHRIGLVLGGRPLEPHPRLARVLVEPDTVPEHHAELILGVRVALLGGEAEPFRGPVEVDRYPLAAIVRNTEAVLGFRMSSPGGGGHPPQRLRHVPLHALALAEQKREVELGLRVSSACGTLVPFGSLSGVLCDSNPIQIQVP